ncbi:MAG: AAA family ATPase [Acidobacteriota bacterium]|nr:AAA family ATPase [Acidobacteriota bacterium]
MQDYGHLVGRDALLDEIVAHLRTGRSVLLFGPAGVGKTALVDAAARACPDAVVLDPFEHVGAAEAGRARLALDRGAILLAAARTRQRRGIGRVGRVLWRLRTVRVTPLVERDLRLLLERRLQDAQADSLTLPPGWLHEAAAACDGLPGRAALLADEAMRRWRADGRWTPPAFALAMARAEAWPPRPPD